MIEKQIDLPTKAGTMDTFVCHPERRGPWPAIIFYMDAPGIREELRDMARRLATVGYYVLLPNLYYRAGRGTTLDTSALSEGSPERQRMWDLLKSLTNELVAEDTAAMLAFVDRQSEARQGPLGCVGYCMSGPFVFTVAGRFPERFAATASIYGAGLMTDLPDSPHLLAPKIKGEIYFACAEIDKYAPLPLIAELKRVLEEADVRAEVEIFPGAEHGFAFPQRYCYNKAAAETHWERLFELFRRRLG
jgi:carboxymethylenebutenolidase